jgi:D-sedoheptulose 7-phosphate isomerase
MRPWTEYADELTRAFQSTVAPEWESIPTRMLHFFGNGASATIASHMATDWCRNAERPARAYNDIAWLTATANDAGVHRMFADAVKACVNVSDTVVLISASGRSPNILEAAKEAQLLGCFLVTLSGMAHDNPLRSLGDVNIYVPSPSYGIVETVHAAILHAWLDAFVAHKRAR